ncbi:hypothetical protein ACPCHQ_17085 [Ralstonia thomasii]|jgi:hypothetical protein|uniref:Uncharacterized protein n=3 Tax=Pseudomonadota TaxID=1224 RepID=A0ABM9JVZ0_9RALS|nr:MULTISPECIES: hypothetical protein [Ralstonia]MBT2181009.1 hypothetical protein [Ralstonia pickettii]CAJ0710714.1 hypothetical protein LMG7143_01700 [Ralstonia sp. LMG 18095]CAJ0806225.1 hypothetical protein LMG18095_04405 [Ralstonia sp. LMG 18095]
MLYMKRKLQGHTFEVAAAIGVSAAAGLAGAAMSSGAASDAAQTQADAANRAANMQNAQWQQTQANLRPYLNLGSSAINPLLQAMGYHVNPNAAPMQTRDQIYQNLLPQYTHTTESGVTIDPNFRTWGGADNGWSYNLDAIHPGGSTTTNIDYNGLNSAVDSAMQRQQSNSMGNWEVDPNNILNQTFTAPTAEQARATPGYQFTFNQGMQGINSSAAAKGLGVSGANIRGAADYATGLADSTYNDVFSRALNTFNTNYGSAANRVNRLWNLVSSGQNAAATNGSLGATSMNSIGDTMMSGANASAAGRVGSANALSSGLNGVGSNALLYGLTQNNATQSGSWGTRFNPNDTSTYFNDPAAYG